jgi:hypothetical protein
MFKAQQLEITLKDNNPCLFTVVRKTKFTGLFDTSYGYNVRECGIEVEERRIFKGG